MNGISNEPERERFSLDDPEAGRKLLANLDARKVRLAFSELCWHFRCDDIEDRIRLRTLLETLKSDNALIEPELKLYCRPALAHGATGSAHRKALAKAKRHFRRRAQEVAACTAQAAALLAFISTRGETTAASLKEEATRLAFPDGRVNGIIRHLHKTSKIERVSYGTYRLLSEPQVSSDSDPVP